MELEDQVCAPEYSKRLDELGVKQESYFWWIQSISKLEPLTFIEPFIGDIDDKISESDILYSAFTVSELGNMLPDKILYKSRAYYLENAYHLIIEKNTDNTWTLKYTDEEYLRENIIAQTDDENLANAMAKMLIYLLENGLIEND